MGVPGGPGQLRVQLRTPGCSGLGAPFSQADPAGAEMLLHVVLGALVALGLAVGHQAQASLQPGGCVARPAPGFAAGLSRTVPAGVPAWTPSRCHCPAGYREIAFSAGKPCAQTPPARGGGAEGSFSTAGLWQHLIPLSSFC